MSKQGNIKKVLLATFDKEVTDRQATDIIDRLKNPQTNPQPVDEPVDELLA